MTPCTLNVSEAEIQLFLTNNTHVTYFVVMIFTLWVSGELTPGSHLATLTLACFSTPTITK